MAQHVQALLGQHGSPVSRQQPFEHRIKWKSRACRGSPAPGKSWSCAGPLAACGLNSISDLALRVRVPKWKGKSELEVQNVTLPRLQDSLDWLEQGCSDPAD